MYLLDVLHVGLVVLSLNKSLKGLLQVELERERERERERKKERKEKCRRVTREGDLVTVPASLVAKLYVEVGLSA